MRVSEGYIWGRVYTACFLEWNQHFSAAARPDAYATTALVLSDTEGFWIQVSDWRFSGILPWRCEIAPAHRRRLQSERFLHAPLFQLVGSSQQHPRSEWIFLYSPVWSCIRLTRDACSWTQHQCYQTNIGFICPLPYGANVHQSRHTPRLTPLRIWQLSQSTII